MTTATTFPQRLNLTLTAVTIFLYALFVDLQDPIHDSPHGPLSHGVLIPDTATMVRAWEVPRNPTVSLGGLSTAKAKSVLRGFELFMNTPKRTPLLTGSTMSCNNCHPNGGQREKAMPLVGVDGIFPEYNKRAGRFFSLEERIIGCLLRSINATGNEKTGKVLHHENELETSPLNAKTAEVQDLAAYIRWLSSGLEVGDGIPWRGHNSLPVSSLIPVERLDPNLGKELFTELCSSCHGKDGQGVDLGIAGKRPGPLWGSNSWNDGAGAARTYTLAGMIRYWMPYLNPGFLTDEQAQHIAAYITSQPRPGFPYKSKDYLKEKIPVDAVYYEQLYSKNPLTQK